MVENGIKPVYVFDGKPPTMKAGELEKRKLKRDDAQAARYARALALAGVVGRAAPAGCTAQGLFAIARAAALMPRPTAPSPR